MTGTRVLLAKISVMAAFALVENGELQPEAITATSDYASLSAFEAHSLSEIRAAWDRLESDPTYRGEVGASVDSGSLADNPTG